MKLRTYTWVVWSLLLALLLTSLPLTAFADGKNTVTATEISPDDRNYEWVASDKQTYTYDFSSTEITDYSNDTLLATASLRTNMIFDGQTLSCKEGKTFSIGSTLFLGDDYGLYGGEMSVDASVTGGKLSVGIRLSRTATDAKHRGIWFTLDGTDTITVSEPESRLNATVKADKAASAGKITVKDKASVIELYLDSTKVCSVAYDSRTGGIVVLDAAGKAVASKDMTNIRPAGYFTVHADKTVGHIDNLTFEHNDLTLKPSTVKGFSIDYTTWVATDDRDRTTPTGVDVREGKEVGIFYFLNRGGEDTEFIQDNTKIFLEESLEGLKEHLTSPGQSGGYFWAEPYFGYYKSNSAWVFRKHAYQLEAAGVDFIFLDFTNGVYYPQELQVLLDTWLEMRMEGTDTPDICVFSAGNYASTMGGLRKSMYSEEGFAKYGELFYQYQGKPLTLANCADDTGELSSWIKETFTVRGCWAWMDSDGSWNWLQEYRKRGDRYYCTAGGLGRDFNGNFEQLALCMGHHPTTSKGRSFIGNNPTRCPENDYGFSMDSGAGVGFATQFEAIMQFDPDMVMITGWNEWTAGLDQTHSGSDMFAGSENLGFQLVDQFSPEFSRDGEPMKLRDGEEVGFGDNYYYQMTGYIRQYKGTGAVSQASGQVSIDLTNNDAWENVGPVYGDNVGDVAWRHEEGYFSNLTYVQNTGRNDLVAAKVSQDADYLYFTFTTARDIIVDDGQNWMNLYINLDNNPATGWEGYDLALNRARDGHYVAVESLAEGWSGKHVGQALYTVDGNRMTIRLAKSTVGISGQVSTLCFKWADNSTLTGNIMEFMDQGDTAPNDRFSYLYICPEGEGTAAVTTPAYELMATDGSKVESRDESKPLPGFGNGEETSDTIAPDTDKPAEPGTDTPSDTSDTTNKIVVRKYSSGLKFTIVLTGVVLSACCYTCIVVADHAKKKKK